jgi:hypothetical protein
MQEIDEMTYLYLKTIKTSFFFRKNNKLIVSVVLFLSLSKSLFAEQLITHSDVLEQTISRNTARLYFSQRVTQWPNGQAIKLIVLPDNHPLHIAFCKKILGLYPHQLRRVWDRQLFSGTGQAPITLKTETEIINRINSTPGSLSYISKEIKTKNINKMEVK